MEIENLVCFVTYP